MKHGPLTERLKPRPTLIRLDGPFTADRRLTPTIRPVGVFSLRARTDSDVTVILRAGSQSHVYSGRDFEASLPTFSGLPISLEVLGPANGVVEIVR